MNAASPEIAAGSIFWDKLIPGAIILLDDFGGVGYGNQKNPWSRWAGEHDVEVLTLPSGQGMIIKPPS